MANFYPQQYKDTGDFPINHNYLPEQFSDYEDIWQEVKKVVQQGDFTLGKAVDKFESTFATMNGAKYGIGVGSGTDALFLSLKALGIGPGDEVITTPFTFFATVGAIVTAGATPVFVDASHDFNIDAKKIEKAITSKTKAVIPVHWSGNPCDMDEINTLCDSYHITVVADACHAIQATLHGQGIAQFSELTCFSMHPLKNLNVWGDGGMILTNNESLAKTLYSIRNHGLIDRDRCETFAYNSRLDTIQAVIAQYLTDNKLANISQQRIQHAEYFDAAFSDINQIVLPVRNPLKKSVYHLYMGLFERRDELQAFLNSQGVDAKIHYPIPMHLQPAARDMGYKKGDFPVAESICDNCLSLPVHEYITQDQQDHVIQCVKEFYKV